MPAIRMRLKAAQREAKQLARLQREAKQLRDWLADNPEDRKGVKSGIRLSNRTDNESAKMANQQRRGARLYRVAAVDSQCQIIVEAQAHGTGSEQELLMPRVNATAPMRKPETVIGEDTEGVEKLKSGWDNQIRVFIHSRYTVILLCSSTNTWWVIAAVKRICASVSRQKPCARRAQSLLHKYAYVRYARPDCLDSPLQGNIAVTFMLIVKNIVEM